MQRRLIPTPPDPPRPLIEVMPHISAPIDEHRIIPYPRSRWWQKTIIAGILIGLVAAAMLSLFLHGSTVR